MAGGPGTLFQRGDLLGTSFFQGGPYRFDLPESHIDSRASKMHLVKSET
jgi:hypothetical protein